METCKGNKKLYHCKYCNYSTPRKLDFSKHLETKKHKEDRSRLPECCS